MLRRSPSRIHTSIWIKTCAKIANVLYGLCRPSFFVLKSNLHRRPKVVSAVYGSCWSGCCILKCNWLHRPKVVRTIYKPRGASPLVLKCILYHKSKAACASCGPHLASVLILKHNSYDRLQDSTQWGSAAWIKVVHGNDALQGSLWLLFFQTTMAKGKDKEKAKRLFEDSPSDKGSQKHARKSLPEIPGLNRSEEAASTQELMDDLLFCEELPATPVRPIMKAVEDAMAVDSPRHQQEQSIEPEKEKKGPPRPRLGAQEEELPPVSQLGDIGKSSLD